jgi:hypothetical protein
MGIYDLFYMPVNGGRGNGLSLIIIKNQKDGERYVGWYKSGIEIELMKNHNIL